MLADACGIDEVPTRAEDLVLLGSIMLGSVADRAFANYLRRGNRYRRSRQSSNRPRARSTDFISSILKPSSNETMSADGFCKRRLRSNWTVVWRGGSATAMSGFLYWGLVSVCGGF